MEFDAPERSGADDSGNRDDSPGVVSVALARAFSRSRNMRRIGYADFGEGSGRVSYAEQNAE